MSDSKGEKSGKALRPSNKRHPLHALHRNWEGMKGRCHSPRHILYKNYGAKGIRVCDRWRASFDAFFEDMGPKPSPDHSLDRINNAGNYEPGNVRWATEAEQHRNRSDNIMVTHSGKTQCVTDWARELGITRKALEQRLRTWPLERALTEPRRPGLHLQHRKSA